MASERAPRRIYTGMPVAMIISGQRGGKKRRKPTIFYIHRIAKRVQTCYNRRSDEPAGFCTLDDALFLISIRAKAKPPCIGIHGWNTFPGRDWSPGGPNCPFILQRVYCPSCVWPRVSLLRSASRSWRSRRVSFCARRRDAPRPVERGTWSVRLFRNVASFEREKRQLENMHGENKAEKNWKFNSVEGNDAHKEKVRWHQELAHSMKKEKYK